MQDSSYRLKESIAKCAIELFKTEGYNNVSVNEICEKNELFSGCGSCSDAFSLQQKCLDEWNAPWRWSSRFDVCLLDNKGLCAKQGSCTHFILLSLQNRTTRIGRQPEVIMCTRVRVASITIRNSCML